MSSNREIARTLEFLIHSRENAVDVNNPKSFSNLRHADGSLADFIVENQKVILGALRNNGISTM